MVFLVWLILSVFLFYLLVLLVYQCFKCYQYKNMCFGIVLFDFLVMLGNFYGVYLCIFGLVVLVVVVVGVLLLLLGVLFYCVLGIGQIFGFIVIGLFMYVVMLFLMLYVLLCLQNLVWSNMMFGVYCFQSYVGVGKLFWIFVLNVVMIVIIVGLFMLFVCVCIVCYKFEFVMMFVLGLFDIFVVGEIIKVSVLGDVIVDWYDIDIVL